MFRQCCSAAGYLAIFLMPLLLWAGVVTGLPWLAFGAVVVVFSLLRALFGAIRPNAYTWNEWLATFLDKLPLAHVPAYLLSVVGSLSVMAGNASGLDWVGFALSLWMTGLFATCVVHELIHRRHPAEAMLGHVLAGLCGYPVLGAEHLAHHARPGQVHLAEVPALDESVWPFAARRLRRIAAEFLGRRTQIWAPLRAGATTKRVRWSLGATAAAATGFVTIAGWPGAVTFAATALGVAVGVQIITYIQHWGLGADSLGSAVSYGRGWEDDCRFQAWITLNISLHDIHHRDARLPYYRLSLVPGSPRLPAGYVVLMFASLLPPVWFRLMRPELARWCDDPTDHRSAGRRLTCFVG